MMSSVPAYNAYAKNVLMPAMDQGVLAEIKGMEARGETHDPRYMALLKENHYVHHVLRLPSDQYPDPVIRAVRHTNKSIYVSMQGPSELGLTGTLEQWDRSADLVHIKVPTLVIGAAHDTMDPAYMEAMAGEFDRGSYLFCPEGSHLAIYDDQATYFGGLVKFLLDTAG